jgi:hypothetical protein
MSDEERYEDCEGGCEERYHGEADIRNYLREVENEAGDGTLMICVSCHRARKVAHVPEALREATVTQLRKVMRNPTASSGAPAHLSELDKSEILEFIATLDTPARDRLANGLG